MNIDRAIVSEGPGNVHCLHLVQTGFVLKAGAVNGIVNQTFLYDTRKMRSAEKKRRTGMDQKTHEDEYALSLIDISMRGVPKEDREKYRRMQALKERRLVRREKLRKKIMKGSAAWIGVDYGAHHLAQFIRQFTEFRAGVQLAGQLVNEVVHLDRFQLRERRLYVRGPE